MSFNVVSKGLGGGFLLTEGWGGVGVPSAAPAIVEFSTGSARIILEKLSELVRFTYIDSNNTAICFLEATADQLAGTDWMLIKVTREGTTLSVTLDDNDPTEIELASIETVGGNATVMDGVIGTIYDLRVKEKAISEKAFDYYRTDVEENSADAVNPRV